MIGTRVPRQAGGSLDHTLYPTQSLASGGFFLAGCPLCLATAANVKSHPLPFRQVLRPAPHKPRSNLHFPQPGRVTCRNNPPPFL